MTKFGLPLKGWTFLGTLEHTSLLQNVSLPRSQGLPSVMI